jgi:hypothetical protein
MKKYAFAAAVIVAAVWLGWGQLHHTTTPATSGNPVLASALRERKSGVQVTGEGIVTRVLPDDNDGSRHQRFIVRLPTGGTVLISHNLDLAPRITSLEPGDAVAFSGVYEWNPRGGVIHWTHHDPSGRHPAGWLQHDGQLSR